MADTFRTNINLDFDSQTPANDSVDCGVKCLYAYSASLEFKTIVDEHFSGNEQRRDQWTTPKRTWVLEFAKTPEQSRIMEKFFIRQKGRKKAFNWKWEKTVDGMDTGGDDVTYFVRFDTDRIEFNVMEMGYKTFKVPITQVMSVTL